MKPCRQEEVTRSKGGPEPGRVTVEEQVNPSAEPGTKLTTKIGFDVTQPLVAKGKSFGKADFPDVDLKKYLE